MNRAGATRRAQRAFRLFRLLANGSKRRQNFIPILIALFHSIYLGLMFHAVRMPRPIAKALGAIPGSEIEPTARHGRSSRQQLAANGVLRGDPPLRVPDGNGLSDGLTVIRVVDRVGGDDLSVLRVGRIDFANESTLIIVSLHVAPPSARW